MSLSLPRLRQLPDAQPALAGRRGPFHIPAPAGNGRLLIRPYGRGGLLAGFFPEGFRSLDRGLQELNVSAKARELGLPVAETMALSAERLPSGRWAMEAWSWWLAETVPLAAFLETKSGNEESRSRLLSAVARTIRRCHDAGLSHRDLNSNNVIIKEGAEGFQATLVDLDRAQFLPFFPARLRRAQLRRLYRSLAKEKLIPSVLSDREYSAFAADYFLGEMQRQDLAAFMRSCRRAARWHSLLWNR